MLSLTGTIRAAVTLPGRIDKKTGEAYPSRPVLQIEGEDARGLVQLYTLTVPDLAEYSDKVGRQISVPVRAWASGGASVQLSYEASK
jgi:hypothetical protein